MLAQSRLQKRTHVLAPRSPIRANDEGKQRRLDPARRLALVQYVCGSPKGGWLKKNTDIYVTRRYCKQLHTFARPRTHRACVQRRPLVHTDRFPAPRGDEASSISHGGEGPRSCEEEAEAFRILPRRKTKKGRGTLPSANTRTRRRGSSFLVTATNKDLCSRAASP
ncbi:hypothetical protein MTO96_001244 [Rhipicephalus appendiculatus]